jgi:hypothetical protein
MVKLKVELKSSDFRLNIIYIKPFYYYYYYYYLLISFFKIII